MSDAIIPSRIFSSTERDYHARLENLLAARQQDLSKFDATVAAILSDVKQNGDAALLRLTARFDGLSAESMAQLRVTNAEIAAADSSLTKAQIAALDLAAARISDFHRRQLP